MIFIGITIGGLAGGWIGTMLDHGNGLGAWSIILSTAGSLAGIWAAIRINDYL